MLFSIRYSTNEKTILKVMLKKKQHNSRKKLMTMSLIHVLNRTDELRQPCIKTSSSTVIPNLSMKRPAVVISWTPWF